MDDRVVRDKIIYMNLWASKQQQQKIVVLVSYLTFDTLIKASTL